MTLIGKELNPTHLLASWTTSEVLGQPVPNVIHIKGRPRVDMEVMRGLAEMTDEAASTFSVTPLSPWFA